MFCMFETQASADSASGGGLPPPLVFILSQNNRKKTTVMTAAMMVGNHQKVFHCAIVSASNAVSTWGVTTENILVSCCTKVSAS